MYIYIVCVYTVYTVYPHIQYTHTYICIYPHIPIYLGNNQIRLQIGVMLIFIKFSVIVTSKLPATIK